MGRTLGSGISEVGRQIGEALRQRGQTAYGAMTEKERRKKEAERQLREIFVQDRARTDRIEAADLLNTQRVDAAGELDRQRVAAATEAHGRLVGREKAAHIRLIGREKTARDPVLTPENQEKQRSEHAKRTFEIEFGQKQQKLRFGITDLQGRYNQIVERMEGESEEAQEESKTELLELGQKIKRAVGDLDEHNMLLSSSRPVGSEKLTGYIKRLAGLGYSTREQENFAIMHSSVLGVSSKEVGEYFTKRKQIAEEGMRGWVPMPPSTSVEQLESSIHSTVQPARKGQSSRMQPVTGDRSTAGGATEEEVLAFMKELLGSGLDRKDVMARVREKYPTFGE